MSVEVSALGGDPWPPEHVVEVLESTAEIHDVHSLLRRRLLDEEHHVGAVHEIEDQEDRERIECLAFGQTHDD